MKTRLLICYCCRYCSWFLTVAMIPRFENMNAANLKSCEIVPNFKKTQEIEKHNKLLAIILQVF